MLPYLLLHVKTVTNTYSAVKFVTQAISNDISVVHLQKGYVVCVHIYLNCVINLYKIFYAYNIYLVVVAHL